MLSQHFYPYNFVPNFPYNVESGAPPGQPLDDKNKDPDRTKTTPSPLDKNKQRPESKDNPARPNDNHQILKESIEMKAQMGPYAFQRPPHAREEELRRYGVCYFYYTNILLILINLLGLIVIPLLLFDQQLKCFGCDSRLMTQ